MIESCIIARIIATTTLAFGITGSAAVSSPAHDQAARCPFTERNVHDADVIRDVPAGRSRTIWI